MKNNKLFYKVSAVALITLFTLGVNAAETTKPETTTPTTTTTTPTSSGDNGTGECWMWPNCIVIN